MVIVLNPRKVGESGKAVRRVGTTSRSRHLNPKVARQEGGVAEIVEDLSLRKMAE
jgi:hypothetical protein